MNHTRISNDHASSSDEKISGEDDDTVPDSFVSSSAATLSGSAANDFSERYNRWRTGDWCWVKDQEEVGVKEEPEHEQEIVAKKGVHVKEEPEQEMVAETDVNIKEEPEQEVVAEQGVGVNVNVNVNVKEEQETALLSPAEVPSPRSIRTYPENPKQIRPSLRGCRHQVKRKAATAVTYFPVDIDFDVDVDVDVDVDDDDCDEDYKKDNSTEDCEEDDEIVINDSSNSEMMQGPKMKKARKTPGQGNNSKKWDAMYQSLLEYKAQHGDTLVPTNKNPQLGAWVKSQRKMQLRKKMSTDRVLRLESIGFVWQIQVPWESMFQLLVEYKAQHGDTLAPTKYDKHPQLGRWVHAQRYRYSQKQMPSDRVLRLESIGFAWQKKNPWESMFQLLVEYKAQHGDTLVPTKYDKNPQLGAWVKSQKIMHSNEKLASNRVLRLESIGFVWSLPRHVAWESKFQLLLEYKTQHGNTLVPQKYDQNPRLGTWVDTQRTMHSKNKLSSDRVLRLESIGFVFDRSESNWMHMYCQLCSYKEKHGSTTVPLRWTEVPSLGEWVYVQRYRCEKKERVKLLDDIGFVRHTNK